MQLLDSLCPSNVVLCLASLAFLLYFRHDDLELYREPPLAVYLYSVKTEYREHRNFSAVGFLCLDFFFFIAGHHRLDPIPLKFCDAYGVYTYKY